MCDLDFKVKGQICKIRKIGNFLVILKDNSLQLRSLTEVSQLYNISNGFFKITPRGPGVGGSRGQKIELFQSISIWVSN